MKTRNGVFWLVLQDIAGFTTLSERLASEGLSGTEKLTDFLRGFFSEAESIINSAGGKILKLAGDAYFSVLPGDIPQKHIEELGEKLMALSSIHRMGGATRVICVRDEIFLFQVPLPLFGQDILLWGRGIKKLMEIEDTAGNELIVKQFTDKNGYNLPEFSFFECPHFEPSHRPAVSLFLKIKPHSMEDMIKIAVDISKNMKTVWLTKWVPYLEGYMGLFLFGFPEASGREMEQALEVSLKLKEILTTEWSIGISGGVVYTGVIGGKHFTEQTCLGDSVNVAARLAAYGNQEILLPHYNKKDFSNYYAENAGEILLKGKKKKIYVYRVKDKKPILLGVKPYPLIGRERELRFAIDSIENNRKIVFVGEPGIGKTRILFEAGEYAKESGHHIFLTKSSPNRFPFAGLKPLLESIPPGLLPDYPELPGFLTGKKAGITIEEAKEMLKDIVKRSLPCILLIDDIQWMDLISLNVLEPLIKEMPIPVIATSRPENLEILDLQGMFMIEVPPLSKKETANLAKEILHGNISETLLDFLLKKSGGVPFFVEQILLDSKERRGIVFDGSCWTTKEGETHLPESVYSAILARYDRFPVQAKKVLEYMCCVGNEISEKELGIILPEKFFKGIGVLSREGFILEEEHVYLFRHALVRETIYNTFLTGKKKRLHKNIAQRLEKSFAQSYDVAYHYEKAGMKRKKDYFYYITAVDFAEKGLLEQTLDVIKKIESPVLRGISRAAYHIEKCEYAEAEKILESLKRRASGRNRNELLFAYAILYDWTNRSDRMIEVLEKVSKDKLDKRAKILWENLYAIYHDDINDNETALRFYKKNLEDYKKAGMAITGIQYFNIGWIYFKMRKFSLAEEYFYKTISVSGENRRITAWAYLRLGQIRSREEKYEDAERYLTEALELFRKTDFMAGIFICHKELGYLYILMDKRQKGLFHFMEGCRVELKIYGHLTPEIVTLMIIHGFHKESEGYIDRVIESARPAVRAILHAFRGEKEKMVHVLKNSESNDKIYLALKGMVLTPDSEPWSLLWEKDPDRNKVLQIKGKYSWLGLSSFLKIIKQVKKVLASP